MEGSLEAKILRRRKLDRSATIYGIIAGSLLAGSAFQWIRLGKIPFVEELTRQLGLTSFLFIFQLVLIILLFIILLRGIIAFRSRGLEESGLLKFDHDAIHIQKGSLKYELTGASLQEFSIQLPKDNASKKRGGYHLMIPSPAGTFKCEFDLEGAEQLAQLQHILTHMEEAHQIRIERL